MLSYRFLGNQLYLTNENLKSKHECECKFKDLQILIKTCTKLARSWPEVSIIVFLEVKHAVRHSRGASPAGSVSESGSVVTLCTRLPGTP